MPKTAVIIAHGELEVSPQVREAVAQADLMIAADGGAASAIAQGWWPHLLVGDLDSAAPEVQAAVLEHGGRIVRYPARKDETDTELALRAALESGAEEVLLIGAVGGRLDHTLANVLLLALPEAAQVRLTILAGRQRLFVIRGAAEIRGHPGDLVTLLPIGGDASGIWTTGLEYPLADGTLPLGTPRGVSNVLSEPRATVRVQKGLLLAIVTEQ